MSTNVTFRPQTLEQGLDKWVSVLTSSRNLVSNPAGVLQLEKKFEA
jgi:hypothetical protein